MDRNEINRPPDSQELVQEFDERRSKPQPIDFSKVSEYERNKEARTMAGLKQVWSGNDLTQMQLPSPLPAPDQNKFYDLVEIDGVAWSQAQVLLAVEQDLVAAYDPTTHKIDANGIVKVLQDAASFEPPQVQALAAEAPQILAILSSHMNTYVKGFVLAGMLATIFAS